MSLNLLQLRYFYAVARLGSFTRASESLRIAQPALSKMVKQLEEHLGKTLLVRSKKEVTLTMHGQKALEYCQVIFSSAEELERAMRMPEISAFSTVRIGTSDEIATGILAGLLPPSDESKLPVRPVLQIAPSSEICAWVERRAIDFAFLFYVPETSRSIQVKDLAEYRFRLVVAKRFQKELSVLNSFIGSREVSEGSSHRFPTLQKWRKIRPSAQIRFSSNCIQVHLQRVRLGFGIAIMPDFMISEDLKKGTLVDLLPAERLYFPLKYVARKDFEARPEHQLILDRITDKVPTPCPADCR